MKKLTDILHEIINERYTIDNISENILLLTNGGGKLFLYDMTTNEVVAFIVFGYRDGVDRVYTAVDGYGAFLYECALTHQYPNGLSMSRDGDTSEAAIAVWDKFYKRDDVRKERMYSTSTNYNRETFPKKAKYKNNPKLLKYVLELEDTKFYYSFGKSKLNKMLKRGEKYVDAHDIDVDRLEIDMEFDDS